MLCYFRWLIVTGVATPRQICLGLRERSVKVLLEKLNKNMFIGIVRLEHLIIFILELMNKLGSQTFLSLRTTCTINH